MIKRHNVYVMQWCNVTIGIRLQFQKNGSPSCSDIGEKKLCPLAMPELSYKSVKHDNSNDSDQRKRVKINDKQDKRKRYFMVSNLIQLHYSSVLLLCNIILLTFLFIFYLCIVMQLHNVSIG